jgi:hypothetical protein
MGPQRQGAEHSKNQRHGRFQLHVIRQLEVGHRAEMSPLQGRGHDGQRNRAGFDAGIRHSF